MKEEFTRYLKRSSVYFVLGSIFARLAFGRRGYLIILYALLFFLSLCWSGYTLMTGEQKTNYKSFLRARVQLSVYLFILALVFLPILLLILAVITQSRISVFYALIFVLYDLVLYEHWKFRKLCREEYKRKK